MHRVAADEDWPASWRLSHHYDLLELWGDRSRPGYSYAYRNRAAKALELITASCAPPGSVLDVAAGQGNLSLRLAEAGYRVTWNDVREELAGYVQLKHEHGEISYLPGNILELDPGCSFDVVVLAEVIEHVAHPDRLLAKARELVAPGGQVVVTTPNGGQFRNPLPRFSDCPDPSVYEDRQFEPDADGHIFLLHADELNGLAASAGLRVRRLDVFTSPLTAGTLGLAGLVGRLPEGVVWRTERWAQRAPASLAKRLNLQLAALMVPIPGRSRDADGELTCAG